jgi:hypothetical protein
VTVSQPLFFYNDAISPVDKHCFCKHITYFYINGLLLQPFFILTADANDSIITSVNATTKSAGKLNLHTCYWENLNMFNNTIKVSVLHHGYDQFPCQYHNTHTVKLIRFLIVALRLYKSLTTYFYETYKHYHAHFLKLYFKV